MARLLQSLKAFCLLAGVFALSAVGLSALRIEQETSGLVRDARVTLAMVSDYSREQIARLRDPKQQKALDAGIQTMAVFNGTGRLINTQVLPRAMRVLD